MSLITIIERFATSITPVRPLDFSTFMYMRFTKLTTVAVIRILKYADPSLMNSSGVLMRRRIAGTNGIIRRNIRERMRRRRTSVFVSSFVFALSPAPYALLMSIMEPVPMPVPIELRIILS